VIFRGNNSSDDGIEPVRHISGHIDDWEEVAVDYLDGRLDEGTRASVDSHLHGCPRCAARMQAQQGMMGFLRTAPSEEAPSDLEDAVLRALLFSPSPKVNAQRHAVEQTARRSNRAGWWQRTMVQWIPATAVVVAILAAVVVFGVVRSGTGPSDEGAPTTVASAETAAKVADGEVASLEAAPETTAGPTASTAAAGVTEESAMGMGTETTDADAFVTAAPSMATFIHDRQGMIDSLSAAGGAPAYFLFENVTVEPAAPGAAEPPVTTIPSPLTGNGDTLISDEQAGAVASQITALTGLQPLGDETLFFGTPAFAAYVPLASTEQLVDLLRGVGDSAGLTVSLIPWLDSLVAEQIGTLLVAHEAELVELTATRAVQPSTSDWSFTTSTLPVAADEPAGDREGTEVTTLPRPDLVSTHVLVVILMNTLH
jgi:hypothetical protein